MLIKNADFIIAGAGIIGLTLAIEIKKKFSDCSVLLLEKEQSLAFHASGRNSGVLHAGFYYQDDSLKAKFCKQGNALIRTYCQEKKLDLNHCGKLVVCQSPEDLDTLDKLYDRGKRYNIELAKITAEEANEIDPNVITSESALWSPTTSTVDPMQVMQSLYQDALAMGIEIQFDTCYRERNQTTGAIGTSQGEMQAGYFINAAGLYADQIARQWGFAEQYRIIPFKGLYLYSSLPAGHASLPRVHVYPVPDLNFPFLGVHFTLTVDGKAKIGPTAIPAFWREHYQGLERANLGEMSEIFFRELQLFIGNHFNFRKLAINEIHKYKRANIIQDASGMYKNTPTLSFEHWGKPGIRAQLVNIDTKSLEMDFVFEGDAQSFHVLNAVSPAFTCSMPFATYLVEQIGTKIHG